MTCTPGKSHLLVCLGILLSVGFGGKAWSQADSNRPAETLRAEDAIAGLTASLNRIRTYKATFVLSDPNGKNAHEYKVGWERIPGSDGENLHDKRFYFISPPANPEQRTFVHFTYNGEKAFLCETTFKGEMTGIDGEILPTLDGQMTAIGLTLASLSTHYIDQAPLQRIAANGTFVKKGIETVNGHKCVALYGELGYAEPGPFQVKHDAGVYLRLTIDPLSGFMPVKQEFYWAEEVDGKLVREEHPYTLTAQFKEFEGGVWFPIAGSEAGQDRVVTHVLTLKECVLNIDIPQEEFTIMTWPAGAWVEDKVTKTSFRVPRPTEK